MTRLTRVLTVAWLITRRRAISSLDRPPATRPSTPRPGRSAGPGPVRGSNGDVVDQRPSRFPCRAPWPRSPLDHDLLDQRTPLLYRASASGAGVEAALGIATGRFRASIWRRSGSARHRASELRRFPCVEVLRSRRRAALAVARGGKDRARATRAVRGHVPTSSRSLVWLRARGGCLRSRHVHQRRPGRYLGPESTAAVSAAPALLVRGGVLGNGSLLRCCVRAAGTWTVTAILRTTAMSA